VHVSGTNLRHRNCGSMALWQQADVGGMPQIPNPEYKGEWKPAQIDNPAYKVRARLCTLLQ
jgi:Calreticulin family